jgi:hypothetical protein
MSVAVLATFRQKELETPLQDIHQNAPEIWSTFPVACESVMVPYLKAQRAENRPLDIKLCNSRWRAHNPRTAPPIGLYPWPMLAKS